MSNIAYTPLNAPKTVAKPGRVLICRNGECKLSLVFGIYFDGTNNNLYEDEPSLSHSNVARLYNAAYKEPINGLHAIYIPGVGTPFPLIGEDTPHEYGASMGVMGAERIRYALLAITNRISRVLIKKDLVPEEKDKIRDAVKTDDNYTRWNHRLTALIAQMRQRAQGSQIEEIVIDVFGFSRGAAGARSFVNQLLKHFSPNGQFFCGIPLRIRFVGLFDTVASVGLADSFPGPFEGHQGWADQDLLPIPPQVEQCVHFVAGHEGRKSFPVDLVLGGNGTYPANCIEVVYPGMHSDVGGGYGPRDQGKSRSNQSELLSQIALNDMYDRALRAGVPLRKGEKLDRAGLKEQFAIHNTLRRYCTSYLTFMKSRCEGKPVVRQYESHLRHYLHWRREVLADVRFLAQPCMGDGISKQDQINMLESNRQFRLYIAQLGRADALLSEYEATHSKYKDPRIPPPPVDTEALGYYRKYWKERFISDADVHTFFETYVHDSRAGFTIVDPATKYDHQRIHRQLKERDARYQQALKDHDRIVSDYHVRGEGSGYTATTMPARPRDPLTPRERQNLAIYNKTPEAPEKIEKGYVEVPIYDDRQPGTWDNGSVELTDGLAAMDRRREGRWSYLHPRQHFAYSRLSF
ncbi:T6SS phospholipase effector Tle1-like catalytic domain-containing protein [Lysobacter arvi]|uniref:DUF2235 domain-containing protein n=1 Tax=Lysobacter arvi TaxID=3038776 RepID=A0ABU1CET7_9GAMM|nr:DUF2235 domain-containing protein [Lysobacter arvi]MDR0183172.1 DUF2235 domain-containing protein [Lysobacter arvi]